MKTKNFNPNISEEKQITKCGISRYFYMGFLTNVLNPKAILYFMVLYPQFINSDTPITMQFFEMGIITAFICLLWYIIVATIFTKIRVFFTSAKCQRWMMRFTGIIFITFGLKLAAQKLE